VRTLFVIVGLLGLFLTGLGAFQIRAAKNYEAGVRDIQQMFVRMDEAAEAKAKERGGGYEIASFAYFYGSRLNGFDSFERGWMVVTFTGGALFVLGISGIILQNRRYNQESLLGKSSEPN